MTQQKTILVVEDDSDSRQAICTMLESLGYGHRAYADGVQALAGVQGELASGVTFHLALLDIMLPGMNGYEVLQELKKLPQFASLPIIMVTAKDADSEIIEGYKYGADYYITKPFTTKQLRYGLQLYLGASEG